MFDASLRALAPEGRLLTLGYVSGRIPSAPANRLLLRNSRRPRGQLARTDLRAPGAVPFHRHRSGALLTAGMPGPAVVEYDLTDGARAFADLEARAVVGKAVLRIR